jgi:hypothetical protein
LNSGDDTDWGAHSFRVLVIAFCDHELFHRIDNRFRNGLKMGRPSPQNAATNTLQACAPRN